MKNRACNRIVITGISPITPIGTGEKKFWQAACAGENGIMEIKSFDTSQFKIHKGCEVKDFKFNDIYINKEKKYWEEGLGLLLRQQLWLLQMPDLI